MSGDRPAWTFPKRDRELGLRSIGRVPPSATPPWAKKPGEDDRRSRVSPSKSRTRSNEDPDDLQGDQNPLKLRRTEGMYAVAAWAARKEILDLLEAGADARSLITLLKEGKEEGPKLLESDLRSSSPKSGSPNSRGSVDSRGEDRQFGKKKGGPFSSSSTPLSSARSSDTRGRASFGGLEFGRKAQPPSRGVEKFDKSSSRRRDDRAGSRKSPTPRGRPQEPKELNSQDEEGEDFRKRACRPPEIRRDMPKTPTSGYVPAKIPTRSNLSEQEVLLKFQKLALENYESLVMLGVKMELTDLIFIDQQDKIDEEKFHWYTEPRSVGTGYRYACMLRRLIDHHISAHGDCSLTPYILGRDAILEFIEKLVREGAGFRTPQGLLYSLEWFGVAFGFQTSGFRWPRCKRMADDYAKKAPVADPAPYLEVAVLAYLEKVVLDIHRPLYARVTAGKLRLCAQAAIRHSDLTRTSFRRLEWCRLQGTTGVLGLRARVDRTKTGPRPWVASHLGVVARHDNWLPTLVDLLAEAHGSEWHTHEFMGCEVDKAGQFNKKPACIEADAVIIRQIMVEDHQKGEDIPLPIEVARRLRWHGAKATMPTFMTHFGVKSKTIRHTGAWAKSSDSMPDTYLRESQLLVLRAQREVLSRLRSGEKIGALEGLRITDFPKDFEPEPYQPSKDVGRGKQSDTDPAVDRRDFTMEPTANYGPMLPDARHLREEPMDDVSKGDPDEIKQALGQEVKEKVDAEVEEGPNPYLGQTSDSASDSDLDDPDDDLENYFGHFLTVDKKGSRIHKPLTSGGQTMPMCRVRGETFLVTEAWASNTMACQRCFGKADGCTTPCTHTRIHEDRVLRCGRRCTLGCGRLGVDADERIHSCALHMSENISRDV